jgi:hypothetical protein
VAVNAVNGLGSKDALADEMLDDGAALKGFAPMAVGTVMWTSLTRVA